MRWSTEGPQLEMEAAPSPPVYNERLPLPHVLACSSCFRRGAKARRWRRRRRVWCWR